MKRYLFCFASILTLALAAAFAFSPRASAAEKAAKRPNILWIVSEDNGPFLGCYGCKDATTPNLDKLAGEGILYENAFTTAPVCAESQLHHHRHVSALARLPAHAEHEFRPSG